MPRATAAACDVIGSVVSSVPQAGAGRKCSARSAARSSQQHSHVLDTALAALDEAVPYRPDRVYGSAATVAVIARDVHTSRFVVLRCSPCRSSVR